MVARTLRASEPTAGPNGPDGESETTLVYTLILCGFAQLLGWSGGLHRRYRHHRENGDGGCYVVARFERGAGLISIFRVDFALRALWHVDRNMRVDRVPGRGAEGRVVQR